MSARSIAMIREVFAMFCDVKAEPDSMARFFTPDYRQSVDGRTVDLQGFLGHVQALRAALVSIEIDIQQIVSDGVSAATVHLVRVVRRSGEKATIKVVAFYRFDGDRIATIDELTHVLEGRAGDEELGSMPSE